MVIPAFCGVPGPGDDNPFWIAGNHVISRHRVIAQNFDLSAEIRQEMPQIPCEAVVIIDQNEQDIALLLAG